MYICRMGKLIKYVVLDGEGGENFNFRIFSQKRATEEHIGCSKGWLSGKGFRYGDVLEYKGKKIYNVRIEGKSSKYMLLDKGGGFVGAYSTIESMAWGLNGNVVYLRRKLRQGRIVRYKRYVVYVLRWNKDKYNEQAIKRLNDGRRKKQSID